jgi:hypothetical protein
MFKKTVQWYRDFYQSQRVRSSEQLDDYIGEAARLNAPWVTP